MAPIDSPVSNVRETGPVALSRRGIVLGASTALAGYGAVGGGTADRPERIADTDEGTESRLVFEDQTTDGTELVVSLVETEFDGFVVIGDEGFDDVVGGPRGRLNVDAGETHEDVTLRPGDTPMEAGEHELTARLQESNGSRQVSETATITVVDPPDTHEGIDPQLVDADPAAGFEYPYYLYAPDAIGDRERPVLVEPVNTGTVDDDLEVHRAAAESIFESNQPFADRIGVPLVVPVFPRPAEDPVDWRHYTHALDETTLGIEDGPLERIDEQVLHMVADAQDRITDATETYPVRRDTNDLALNGFSASGTFVDRFTFLHPERVLSVTAGGLNGMPLLPKESVGGEPLPFHVGIADVESYTGDPVDLDAVDDVNQLLYMGEEDTNDTIPFDDAWTDDDLRQLALDVYGEDMITERFVRSQELYAEAGVDAQFRVYRDAGHTPRPAYDDIVEFHRRSIEGETVSEFGEDLTSDVELHVGTESPAAGETVTFDAASLPVDREANAITWEFDDGGTAAGETVTHVFEEPGTYRVVMAVSYEDGTQESTSYGLEVGEPADSTDDDEDGEVDDDGDEGADGDGDEEADGGGEADADAGAADVDDEVPGFGVVSALAGIGGAGYVLRRRLTTDRDDV